MNWSSIRGFLDMPKDVTGKGVKIAIIDGLFPPHPDIVSNEHRNTYVVKSSSSNQAPLKMEASEESGSIGTHGLWTAAAAGGSGSISDGKYAGIASEADLYLIETGPCSTPEEIEKNVVASLNWVKRNGKKYDIRGVVLTIIGQRDTGLLPWQVDPIRVLCEELVQEGTLVVVASGNNIELVSNSVISPSVLSVGGIVMPEFGNVEDACGFPGSHGFTFEERWTPDVLAPAMNVVLPYPFESDDMRLNHFTASEDNLPRNHARQWGTSYAAPIVLGLAACIWQIHPDWTADQVKRAIISTSENNEKWRTLRAGLISSECLTSDFQKGEESDIDQSKYSRWLHWKERSIRERIESMTNEHPELLDILLSFLPKKLPSEAIICVKRLLQSSNHQIRTAAITVLSTHPGCMTKDEVVGCLNDASPNVRMGGIFALGVCPNFWDEVLQDVSVLINDEHTDIRYNACKLAAQLKRKKFIQPLIDGLEEDARLGRIGTFGKRVSALEAITNHEVLRDPEWQEGENPYSRRSIDALVCMAQKWKMSLSEKEIS